MMRFSPKKAKPTQPAWMPRGSGLSIRWTAPANTVSRPGDDWAGACRPVVCDHRPVAGAVALPAQGLTLTTASTPPSGAPATRPPTTSPGSSASRSRPGPVPQALANALDAELILLGSAGAKAMEVVLGRADIYAHTGGQYEWDSAAPVAVAQAAGFHASRIDGSELR